MQILRLLIRVAFALAVIAGPGQAQNPFAPVIEVNDSVITGFEIDQRQQFLRIISPANSGRESATQELIDDRLRAQVLEQLGLELTEEDIQEGMEEFAGRANLTAGEFAEALAARGVAQETFRDFVAVGIAWREYIRARYGDQVQITERDVDRALAASQQGTGVRVLLSEIIMPAPAAEARTVLARAEEIAQVRSFDAFSDYARRFSATASRDQGGRLGWAPITNLPPALRPQILELGIGEVTQPIPLPEAVALFQLRGIEEVDAPAPDIAEIDYAQYYIAGGRSEGALTTAARVAAQVDRCDDLYAIARDQPAEVLVRQTRAPGEIPQDIALELAKLDRDEVSYSLTTADGQTLIFLMLCSRTPQTEGEIDREAIASRLRSDRLAALAEGLMEQLRADARIRER